MLSSSLIARMRPSGAMSKGLLWRTALDDQPVLDDHAWSAEAGLWLRREDAAHDRAAGDEVEFACRPSSMIGRDPPARDTWTRVAGRRVALHIHFEPARLRWTRRRASARPARARRIARLRSVDAVDHNRTPPVKVLSRASRRDRIDDHSPDSAGTAAATVRQASTEPRRSIVRGGGAQGAPRLRPASAATRASVSVFALGCRHRRRRATFRQGSMPATRSLAS